MSDPSQTDLIPDAAGAEGSARAAPESGAPRPWRPRHRPRRSRPLCNRRRARGARLVGLRSRFQARWGDRSRRSSAATGRAARAGVRAQACAYGKALQADVEPLISSIVGAVRAAGLRPSASPMRRFPGTVRSGSTTAVGQPSHLDPARHLGVIAIAMYFGRGAEWSRVLEGGPTGAGAPGRAIESVSLKPPALPATPAAPGAPGAAPSAPNPPSSSTEPLPSTAPASTGGPASTAAPASTGAASAPSPTSAPAAQSSPDGAASASAPSTPADAGASAAGVPLRLRFERVVEATPAASCCPRNPPAGARDIAGRKPYYRDRQCRPRSARARWAIDLARSRGVARLKID